MNTYLQDVIRRYKKEVYEASNHLTKNFAFLEIGLADTAILQAASPCQKLWN